MKQKLIALSIVAAVFGGFTFAVATAKAADAKADGKAKMLERWDANKDGKLDETEKAAMKEANKKNMEKYDTNKDGKLDEAERAAMKSKGKGKGKGKKAAQQ